MTGRALDRELERLLLDLGRLAPVGEVVGELGPIDVYGETEIDDLKERARALLVALDLEQARRGSDGGGDAA